MRDERAHAKINLVLHILAREANGYHGIETLFQRLALHDTVRVALSRDRTLHCDGPTMPAGGLGAPESNLAWRAAQLYAEETRWDTGWSITIDKHIPVGGGLGGGSADAAAVLRALNTMSPSPVSRERLLELAGTLGADVPFMLLGVSRAWAWGRGDRLLVLPPLTPASVVLYTFAEGVNTGAAYGAFAAMRAASGETVHARQYAADAFDSWERIAAIAANDFELVVPAMHAGVRETLASLRRATATAQQTTRGTIGLMSGSGATCFLLSPSGADLAVETGASLLVTSTA